MDRPRRSSTDRALAVLRSATIAHLRGSRPIFRSWPVGMVAIQPTPRMAPYGNRTLTTPSLEQPTWGSLGKPITPLREPRGQAGPEGGGAGRFELRLVYARRFGEEPAAQLGSRPIAPATVKACTYLAVISSCAATKWQELAHAEGTVGRSSTRWSPSRARCDAYRLLPSIRTEFERLGGANHGRPGARTVVAKALAIRRSTDRDRTKAPPEFRGAARARACVMGLQLPFSVG